MNLPTQPYKGARDFYPEDKAKQQYLFSAMRRIAESYGYEEYDAPILEPLEIYKSKSSEEIVSEQTYSFVDRGGREVVIRPEMTPSVSRMVASRRQELAYPLRWYSIPNLWRYERPQRGRLREHWQLNVDIFGEETLYAESELISLASDLLASFGAEKNMYHIKVNSRKLTGELLTDHLGLTADQVKQSYKLLDKIHKITDQDLSVEINKISNNDSEISKKISEIIKIKSLDDLPDTLRNTDSVSSIQSLLDLLHEAGIDNVSFDLTVVRGFDYYTDIVFEVFDSSPENSRSMFGGGRYDGLVGQFGVDPLPTAGFGMGDVTLLNFLETHRLLPQLGPKTDAVMVLIGNIQKDVISLARQLRAQGLNISVDATNRKLDKKIKTADKQNIQKIIIIGQDEIDNDRFTLKDIRSGSEEKMSAAELVQKLKPVE